MRMVGGARPAPLPTQRERFADATTTSVNGTKIDS